MTSHKGEKTGQLEEAKLPDQHGQWP